MPMPSYKLDKGIRNRQDLAASVAQSMGATYLSLGMDPDSHFGFDIPALDLPQGKEAVEQILQAVFAKANGELARLLQDVRTKSAAGQLGTAQNGSTNKLLMRAIQCAVKQCMLQAELGSLALSDELTGVYNRRGFLALAERQLKLGRRSGRAILVFFADVDGSMTSLAIRKAIWRWFTPRRFLKRRFGIRTSLRDSAVTNLPYSPWRSPVTASPPSALVSIGT